jgi:hypothetical protein
VRHGGWSRTEWGGSSPPLQQWQPLRPVHVPRYVLLLVLGTREMVFKEQQQLAGGPSIRSVDRFHPSLAEAMHHAFWHGTSRTEPTPPMPKTTSSSSKTQAACATSCLCSTRARSSCPPPSSSGANT